MHGEHCKNEVNRSQEQKIYYNKNNFHVCLAFCIFKQFIYVKKKPRFLGCFAYRVRLFFENKTKQIEI